MADEIPDANVVRLWRDPGDGLWRALLGPADGRGLMCEGQQSPRMALSEIAWDAFARGWSYDPTAPGPEIQAWAEP